MSDKAKETVTAIRWDCDPVKLESIAADGLEFQKQYIKAHSIPELVMRWLLDATELQDQEDGSGPGYAYLKLFNPTGAATWWVSEIRRRGDDWELYGLADLGMGCREYGYTMLSELTGLRLGFGLSIERDIYFKHVPLADLAGGE